MNVDDLADSILNDRDREQTPLLRGVTCLNCSECRGRGIVRRRRCPTCDGRRVVIYQQGARVKLTSEPPAPSKRQGDRNTAERRLDRIAKGQCSSCGKPQDRNGETCESCTDYARKRAKSKGSIG